MVSRAAPVRTCVGCRRRAPASELLRVVAGVSGPPGRIIGTAVFVALPDPIRRRPGRGAHIHPDLSCLGRAEKRRAFGRALRVDGSVDTHELGEFVANR